MNFPASTCLSALILFASTAWLRGEDVDYARDIKPLLQLRCYACHGALKQQSGLRLDTAELMLEGGDSGPAVAPGKPDESPILQRVTESDVASRMPPEHEGEPFTAAQVELLRKWIANGAAAPADEVPESDPSQHWAFQPRVRPPVPQVPNAAWVRNPIDAFIAQGHHEHGLAPQPEADRAILVRRLYLDLHGLPPSPAELASIEADQSSDWYEQLVNRLLEDPRYGQRWGRHWMDVWRYSDWWGLGQQLRNSQKHIWHWRDWIVESLNEDMPYDEMIRLMLAADELYPNDLDKLRATGYLARNYFLFNRHQWMDETVEHVSKGFLGLTMNCAKCHDHKFDPIAQTDYYAMRAFFEPYHVRLDAIPGQADLDVDGIPRAFDGQLDTPTYLFIRGQESSPDQSKPIAPGVPSLLANGELSIEPVQLPAEAWQPERREWVIETHLANAEQQVASTAQSLRAAEEKLAAVKAKAEPEKTIPTEGAAPSPAAQASTAATSERLDENFEAVDARRWQQFGGEWVHQPGRLEQRRDGATRSVLRWLGEAPRDFDATVRFTMVGGSKWRSVCLCFDSTQADPSDDASAGSEQVVYVSAVGGGSKVQASLLRDGKREYPEAGRLERSIEVGHEYALRVQARDRLVNVSLDGEPVLAWRSPLERRDGAMQLTTFDALVQFHAVSIAPLAADVQLTDPDAPVHASEFEVAQAEVEAAHLAVAAARATQQSVQRRAEAMRASWAKTDALSKSQSNLQAKSQSNLQANREADAEVIAKLEEAEHEAARAAVHAEREAALAEAKRAVAAAELKKLGQPKQKQRAAAEKELKAAQEQLAKASKQADEPGEAYTKLAGAVWCATRFFNSTKDDPEIAFPPTSSGRRTALAKWIASAENPLTARVAVNQIWARHMGTPLVATVFDFGRKGAAPTHPQLLDWLASELVDSGWSMKHVHRLITTSSVYRLSSSTAGAEANLAKDPDNVYWWRRTPARIEAEVVRDSILSLAATLDERAGGPPVLPAEQARSNRRSLYFFHSNNERNLFLMTFNEAAVTDCYRREQSIVPQQALALTNSRLVLEAAPRIAERLSQRIDSDTAFVRLAFQTLLGMSASDAEVDACLDSLKAWREQPSPASGSKAQDARANLIWALLNHNDFVTLR
ncbi:MAG: PSD1 and planctomycete cytochrome C domain-containing protein [Aureliella sp.]